MSHYPAWNPLRAQEILANQARRRGALLPVLHALQHEFGYIHTDAVQLIAGALNLTPADVQGVISFYHDFRTEALPSRLVRICRAEACRATGGLALIAEARAREIAAEEVYCFGNCALGPNVEIAGRLHGRVDPARLASLIAEAK